MNIEKILLQLLQDNGFTVEDAAKKLNISVKNLEKRFGQNKLRFNETQIILDMLGYKINFVKND